MLDTNPTYEDFVMESRLALELPRVMEEVSKFAHSEPGKIAVVNSQPGSDREEIQVHQQLTAQLREYISLNNPIPIHGLLPLEGLLERLEQAGVILDSEELLIFRDFLALSDTTKNRLDHAPDRYTLVPGLGDEIDYLGDLRTSIDRVFDQNGEVRPNASRELARIHDRTRHVKGGIKQRLEKIVHDRDLARIVQEDYITLRNDRYVILLRPEFKGLLDGIVHDHSRSGSSVYVEPFSVVELNNEIAELLDEEREEIRRIHKMLTDLIKNAQQSIERSYQALINIDAQQARALYSASINGVSPVPANAGFRIIGGRHPLLINETDEVVPMNVIQEPETAVTVISGANMGGKTVALKIAGLFSLMVRCGLQLPAKEGTEIQLFSRIMADIGDDQDIRSKISSFSGHMLRVKSVLEFAKEDDLVLLDELGGATDPDEGAALAMAILDSLVKRKVRVVVTTHLTQLKAYALSRPYVKNVSVEFQPVTLKPTFNLLYDLPGESHAIVTAERIGLPQDVIELARNYLDKSAGGSSQLIQNLREKLREIEEQQVEIEQHKHELESRMAELNSERETLLDNFRKEARELLNKAQRQISELQQNLKNKREKVRLPKSSVSIDEIKQELIEKLGTLDRKDPEFKIGAHVVVQPFGRKGIVTDILAGGKVGVAIGNLNITANAEDIKVVAASHSEKSASKNTRTGVEMSPTSPQWEVKVIGMRVEDALPVVERTLDQAALTGLASVNIIHGKGTGRLRKAIWDYLTGHPLVRGFTEGDMRLGGSGVTIVEIVTE